MPTRHFCIFEGKKVTLKDLGNLQQSCKIVDGNNIKQLVDDLLGRTGSIVELTVNEENEFASLLYQDQYMKDMFANYPELLLVDATFKLLDYPISCVSPACY